MNTGLFFSAGDASFFTSSQLQLISWLPQLWNGWQGFGQSMLFRLWYDYPIQIIIKLLSSLGLSWWVIDKILWLVPWILGAIGAWRLARYFSLSLKSACITSCIFITNTYILMLFGGGQYGVFAAFCITPFVLQNILNIFDKPKSHVISTGLWMSVLLALDLRLTYIVLLMSLGYFTIQCILQPKNVDYYKHVAHVFLLSGLVVFGVHAFWVLPSIMTGFQMSSLGKEITGSGMISFLSFADFSHTLSLLHPNWPENLFGKVYFLQPEFLLLPILALGGFLLYRKKKSITQHIEILALIALFSAFLAKGSQPPFGWIYLWLFDHVPGFVMFRDPTKFFLFIAIGYSLLIPYTLEGVSLRLKKMKWIVYFLFLLFWLFTLRPLLQGRLTGNFTPQPIPFDYVHLTELLTNDNEQSRIMWVPKEERFGITSETHPYVTTDLLFANASTSALLSIIGTDTFQKKVAQAGVKYIIIPNDVYKRIFLSDYRFDENQRDVLIKAFIDAGYKKQAEFNTLGVFINSTFTFTQEKPRVIEEQEVWAIRGVYISIGSLATCVVIVLIRKRKKYIK